ncbi:MAG: PhzF family phenazine biosynthesis protein [Deltaproteobacteria bacterium]|nr:PhzF family phenazine biosynthesis protein [Deltaproteobacteria bacterium]
MGEIIIQIDAFTDRPFRGNPAAVCILSRHRDDTWMQSVAREMNLSETAFLEKREDGFNLRWFTPAVEVELCGHATLASAHALWEIGYLNPKEQARFFTKSGLLTAALTDDWIEMNFPVEPETSASAPPDLSRALGVGFTYVGKNRFDYLVEIDSEESIRRINPDFSLLATIPMRGVIVTSPSRSTEYDFVSRFFAPQVGVNEDPVTGSAHCCLGPYWGARLGKHETVGYQASSRGGIVRVRMDKDRVYLGGQAVTVLRGELSDHC